MIKYKYLSDSQIRTIVYKTKNEYQDEKELIDNLCSKLNVTNEQAQFLVNAEMSDELKESLFKMAEIEDEIKNIKIYETSYFQYKLASNCKYLSFLAIFPLVIFILGLFGLVTFNSDKTQSLAILLIVALAIIAIFWLLALIFRLQLVTGEKLKKDKIETVKGNVYSLFVFGPNDGRTKHYDNIIYFNISSGKKRLALKKPLPFAVKREYNTIKIDKEMLKELKDKEIEFTYYKKHKYVIESNYDIPELYYKLNYHRI